MVGSSIQSEKKRFAFQSHLDRFEQALSNMCATLSFKLTEAHQALEFLSVENKLEYQTVISQRGNRVSMPKAQQRTKNSEIAHTVP